MENRPIGYQHLVEKYSLPARPLERIASVDTTVKARRVKTLRHRETLVFENTYYPKDTLAGHLQFALKYEGVNLEVLALLFGRTGGREIESWLVESPESWNARRAGFLYEWLTGGKLEAMVSAKTRYVPVVDAEMQFAMAGGRRIEKFKFIDNLPGAPAFCPMVRRTAFLAGMMEADLEKRIKETLGRNDPDRLRREAAFLCLKEAQSSFEVERENPRRNGCKGSSIRDSMQPDGAPARLGWAGNWEIASGWISCPHARRMCPT
jgi:hypothetical protein